MHIVIAGNVVEDRVPGGWAPGGPSLYSARMALALGARVTLVTRLPGGYPRDVLEGLDVRPLAATVAPRYANTYDEAGERTQLLLEPGEQLSDASAFESLAGVDAVIVAPAYHELSGIPAVTARVLAVSLQGPLRETGPGNEVHACADPMERAAPFIRPGVLAFFSEEDTPQAAALAAHIAVAGGVALLTRGFRGALMYHGDVVETLPAVEANPVEPTGAGDCFATAFVVRFAETGSLHEAARFGLAAGALATEAPGLAGVATREQVEARLARVAA